MPNGRTCGKKTEIAAAKLVVLNFLCCQDTNSYRDPDESRASDLGRDVTAILLAGFAIRRRMQCDGV
jgi:hypothetical protein